MKEIKSRKSVKIALSLAGIFFLTFLFAISAPYDFPLNKIITVEKGATLKQVTEKFKEENLVRYSILFDFLVRYAGHEKDIKAGKYMFNRKLSLIGLMQRLVNGDYGIPTVKITIPEGSMIVDINKIFAKAGFEDFKIASKELEGYLFPDTYFFLLDNTPEEVVARMTENLKNKTVSMENDIAKSKRNFDQILTMASLIEKEASDYEDRRMIAGILWKRLDQEMPLQVDAAFLYFLGKNTFGLTSDDLKIDSPYNTYRYRGLPPTPIDNPGLDAIKAAIFPEKTPYLYYLSDKSGNLYYAKTFEGHKLNRAKYLD